VVLLARIICLVQTLIHLVLVCVMLVRVLKHINYHIICLLVHHLLLCSLFIPMFGVMPLNLLVARSTMFLLLTIIVNSLGSTYFVTSLRSLSIFLNFKPLLSACLITKLSLFSLIGVGNTRILIPFFVKLVLLTKSRVLTPISKMALSNASTAI
jgi:hypothetical protein